jgi:hypothetical protein
LAISAGVLVKQLWARRLRISHKRTVARQKRWGYRVYEIGIRFSRARHLHDMPNHFRSYSDGPVTCTVLSNHQGGLSYDGRTPGARSTQMLRRRRPRGSRLSQPTVEGLAAETRWEIWGPALLPSRGVVDPGALDLMIPVGPDEAFEPNFAARQPCVGGRPSPARVGWWHAARRCFT